MIGKYFDMNKIVVYCNRHARKKIIAHMSIYYMYMFIKCVMLTDVTMGKTSRKCMLLCVCVHMISLDVEMRRCQTK